MRSACSSFGPYNHCASESNSVRRLPAPGRPRQPASLCASSISACRSDAMIFSGVICLRFIPDLHFSLKGAVHSPRRKTISKHQPQFDLPGPLHRLTGGADLSQIDSIGPHAALQIIAEIGTDMRRWSTEKHFASWLALAPNNKISGGPCLARGLLPRPIAPRPFCAAAR